MKPPIVCCTACHGKGETPLSAPLLETLVVIQKFSPVTIPDIYRHLNSPTIVSTAINKRVSKLVKLKLVQRKNEFGTYFYSPARIERKRPILICGRSPARK